MYYCFIIYLPRLSLLDVPVQIINFFLINLFNKFTAVVLLLPITLLISSLVAPLLLIINSIAFCSGYVNSFHTSFTLSLFDALFTLDLFSISLSNTNNTEFLSGSE